MGAASYRLLGAANSNTVEGFLHYSRRSLKKRAAVVGFGAPFRFSTWTGSHNRRRKTKTESKPQGNHNHENRNHFQPFTAYYSTFAVCALSHRAYTHGLGSGP